MKSVLAAFLFFILGHSLSGQIYMKPGIVAGPSFTWVNGNAGLRDGFFGVTRTAFNAGICNSLQVGSHFFSKISVLYSMQNFAIRQTGIPEWRTDVRYRISRLEIPLVAGSSGFIGNLRHREYLGAALSIRMGERSRVTASGDSVSSYTYSTQDLEKTQSVVLLLAGFEVGTTFKNDASVYFGGVIRWGLNQMYGGEFESNRFMTQDVRFKGSYAGLEITLYFPRYAYWFKREFTY
jgi:hypothetical protein